MKKDTKKSITDSMKKSGADKELQKIDLIYGKPKMPQMLRTCFYFLSNRL